jgi:hypothetical protein
MLQCSHVLFVASEMEVSFAQDFNNLRKLKRLAAGQWARRVNAGRSVNAYS